eukprot:m.1640142 g.1640142  ORF g.1640142 m.1640142 type:complete len:60 (-) comp39878_c0_seq1:42-221(-)
MFPNRYINLMQLFQYSMASFPFIAFESPEQLYPFLYVCNFGCDFGVWELNTYRRGDDNV